MSCIYYFQRINKGDENARKNQSAGRGRPSGISARNKKRIANGAGVKVEDVNKLLKSFEQMRSLVRQFSGPGAGKKMKRMKGFGGFGGFPGM